MRPGLRTALAIAAIVLLVAPGARQGLIAHPGADTDVVLSFAPNGVVEIALTTSADSLRLKLEALSGGDAAPSPQGEAEDAAAVITRLRQTLLDRLTVAVDGRRLDPEWIGLAEPVDPIDVRRGKVVARARVALPDGGAARTVTWRTGIVFGSYMLIVQKTGGASAIQWLQGPEWSGALRPDAAVTTEWLEMAWTGIAVGFTHIVPKGLDHILFVLGLFLLTPRVKPLLLQVTLFTVAHSVTLALGTVGLVSVPADVVEPLIALSIVYIAFENLVRVELTASRLALVFAFGLLHGLGFASVLAAADLPQASLLTTLATFNLGVECGQLAVIAAAALAVRVLALAPARYQRLVARPASVAIAAMGALWLIERL